MIRELEFDFLLGQIFFCSPLCTDRLWGPLSLLSSGYEGLVPWCYSSQGMKLTTYLYLLLRLEMLRDIISTPLYVSMTWCLIKHRENLIAYIVRAW
jgi:hypothetical protein